MAGPSNLSVRIGDVVVPAAAEDQSVVQHYDIAVHGPVRDGRRLTILSGSIPTGVSRSVRIIHVVEAVDADVESYVAGPKRVWGDHIDDAPVDEGPAGGDLFTPADSDGKVVTGPFVDAGYEITEHELTVVGTHTVQWKVGDHVSNTLAFEVT